MKDIPGFPGYKITEDGKLYNPKGKLITRSDTWQGYPRARLKHESGSFKNRKIHTLVALAHLGEGKEVRHLDNNRANFHLHNLEWGDRFSNAQDRLARGSYHLKTQLVKGKSLLILGDDKYLDPEAKKVYHVTDHPIGEEGVIPITSLEKVASKLYPSAHADLFNKFTPVELTNNKKFRESMIAYSPSFLKRQFVIPKKVRDLADKGHEGAKGLLREHSFNSRGFIKKAEWTSKKNADAHALKHAHEMGLTDEEYLKAAKKALKGKLSLINIKNDVHKSRSGKNILVHKDKKIISFYPISKVAYVRKVKKHLEKAVSRIRDSEHHSDAYDIYQRRQEAKKKK